MTKEQLINEAIKVWCNYGKAINTTFGLTDFYIDGEPLQKVLSSDSEEKIKTFIEYIKKQTVELYK